MIPVLLGTHEYEWAIKIFADLFYKYFGDGEVIYFGDKQETELPFNIKFRQVPCFSEGVWDWNTAFGEGLKSICYSNLDKTLLIFLPDHWLNNFVGKSVILQLVDYMKHNQGIIRANLTDDTAWHTGEVESVELWQNLEIVEIKPWSIHAGYQGAITFCPSLWNPQLLGRLIESGWDLATCEKVGSDILKRQYPKIRTVGSWPAALTRTHGLFHAQPNRISLAGLSEEDKEVVMKHLPEGYTCL